MLFSLAGALTAECMDWTSSSGRIALSTVIGSWVQYLGAYFYPLWLQSPKLLRECMDCKMTKRSPDSNSQSPSTNMYRSQKSSSSQAKYLW